MNRNLVLLISVTLTVAMTASAKPKEKAYSGSCDRVWIAVKRATAPPHYNFSQLDDAQKKGIVSTGNFATGKRLLDVTLTGTGNTCTVAIGGSFSGLAHNDKADLFDRISKALIEIPEPAPEVAANEKTSSHDSAAKTVPRRPLTNADVLKLKTAGLSEQLIIDAINASPADYHLDTDDLVELKRAGLSDAILKAMIQASRR